MFNLPAAGFSSTLRTLSSILCGRSIRVPNRRVDEIRGVPIACTTSWQRLMAANTSSHSPSMLVPYACSLVFRPASASTRSHVAISLETDTPTPIGIKHRSAITRIITFQSYCPSIVRFVPTAGGSLRHRDRVGWPRVLPVGAAEDQRRHSEEPVALEAQLCLGAGGVQKSEGLCTLTGSRRSRRWRPICLSPDPLSSAGPPLHQGRRVVETSPDP